MRTECATCGGTGRREIAGTDQTACCSCCGGVGFFFDNRCPRCGKDKERKDAFVCDACNLVIANELGSRTKGGRGRPH
jgi:hypothetical protein